MTVEWIREISELKGAKNVAWLDLPSTKVHHHQHRRHIPVSRNGMFAFQKDTNLAMSPL